MSTPRSFATPLHFLGSEGGGSRHHQSYNRFDFFEFDVEWKWKRKEVVGSQGKGRGSQERFLLNPFFASFSAFSFLFFLETKANSKKSKAESKEKPKAKAVP